MTLDRTLLVGGLGSIYDPLLVAALEGAGVRVKQLPRCSDAALRGARALGNHGQCNPAHYAVGAVLESALDDRDFADEHVWLTLGSCGPCRLASFGMEWARVLRGAGLGRLPVLRAGDLDLADAMPALVEALVAGDVLSELARRHRPYAPEAIDAWLYGAVERVAGALARRASVRGALDACRQILGAVPRDDSCIAPRVLLVGEPWATIVDGDPNYDLVRRLGHAGALVDAPLASDWLRYRLSIEGGVDRKIRAVRRLFGIPARRGDIEELAELARPYYDPAVLGGSAHLEIGRALRAARDRSAHLVLSIKPFGCLPSSHLSDGILSVLAREGKTPPFLAVETTGSADASVESRIEMALHAARMAAQA